MGLFPLLQPMIVLGALVGIYALMFGFFNRSDPDRTKFAKLRMSRWTGPNAGVVLAALAVSQLFYSATFLSGSTEAAGLGFTVAVGLIFLIVALHNRGERLVELIGVGAFVALAFVQDGAERGFFFVIVAVALLMVLSMLRFLFGK